MVLVWLVYVKPRIYFVERIKQLFNSPLMPRTHKLRCSFATPSVRQYEIIISQPFILFPTQPHQHNHARKYICKRYIKYEYTQWQTPRGNISRTLRSDMAARGARVLSLQTPFHTSVFVYACVMATLVCLSPRPSPPSVPLAVPSSLRAPLCADKSSL